MLRQRGINAARTHAGRAGSRQRTPTSVSLDAAPLAIFLRFPSFRVPCVCVRVALLRPHERSADGGQQHGVVVWGG